MTHDIKWTDTGEVASIAPNPCVSMLDIQSLTFWDALKCGAAGYGR